MCQFVLCDRSKRVYTIVKMFSVFWFANFYILFEVSFFTFGKMPILGKNTVSAQFDCVTPPMECPNENITFWLYTRKNKDDPHELIVTEPKTIDTAPWVKDAPIKVIVHGYTGHKNFAPNVQLRPAYMKCCDYNLISVDYNPLARDPCYIEAVRNTELVGMCTAHLIDAMVRNHGFTLDKFHVIGFSLGGQIAGFIGQYVTVGQLERVTGLDPALPLFVTHDPNKKIDKGDAKFVDILHTNALEKGKLEALGHVDFYANGGIWQPGCKPTKNKSMSSCNHDRAPEYYAESINSKVGFYGIKCYSWIIYMIGWCELLNSSEEELFGEYVSHHAEGLYFFTTNSEQPYARGSNERQKRSISYFNKNT